MSLSIGIVGLPNVGKSTLFNALTKNNILAANYPFATIEPNTGIVPIPDERLAKLADIYGSQRILPATVNFVDIAGLVEGASKGEGLGNQFLSHIRSTNAIVQVVRAFDDDNVQHVDSEHNPKKDISVINTELVLADLQTVNKRLPQIQKLAKNDPKMKSTLQLLEEVSTWLNDGKPLFDKGDDWLSTNSELLHDLHLLTMKPIIYLFNVGEEDLKNSQKITDLQALVAPAQAIFVSAKLESELQNMDIADAKELLESYGFTEVGLEKLIHSAYNTLGLQSYLTAGEKEVRAWTIKQGSTAPQAAGVIHTDFEKGFIAAQVIDYNDLIDAGSEAAAKSAGKVATVGKDYIMKPDDIVEFRFNVSK